MTSMKWRNTARLALTYSLIAAMSILCATQVIAADYFQFDSYQRTDIETCVECEKSLTLAKDIHGVVQSMIKQRKVTKDDVLLANNKLQGMIAVTQSVADKKKNDEDCPSLVSSIQVMPPTRSLKQLHLRLSKDVPFSEVRSFGFSNRYGSRYYLKAMDGSKKILVEVQVIENGRVRINTYDYPYDDLKEPYNLPDLGSSSMAKNTEKEKLFALDNVKKGTDFLGGKVKAKGEISIKKSEASVAAELRPFDSSGKVIVNKDGIPTLELEKKDEYYTVHYRQTYDQSDKEKKSITLSSPKSKTSATLSKKGEWENQVDLSQKINYFDSDITLSTEIKEVKGIQSSQQKVEVQRKGTKIISATVDSKDNFSVTVPTYFTVSESNKLAIAGENTISTKENIFSYSVILDDKELATYSHHNKHNSTYSKQSLSRNVVEDSGNGKINIKIEEVKGATAADNERDQTTLWMTFEKKF